MLDRILMSARKSAPQRTPAGIGLSIDDSNLEHVDIKTPLTLSQSKGSPYLQRSYSAPSGHLDYGSIGKHRLLNAAGIVNDITLFSFIQISMWRIIQPPQM